MTAVKIYFRFAELKASWPRPRVRVVVEDARDAVAVEAESVATRLGGKARTSNAPGAPLDSATLAGFDADDRARAIERWLSADGVLDSLYPEEVGGPAPAEHK